MTNKICLTIEILIHTIGAPILEINSTIRSRKFGRETIDKSI